MEKKDENNTSIIPIGSTGLVRVGNSIDITNKIIKEHEERSVSENFKSVKIGNQFWMTENLDVDCYLNGDPIPQVQNPKDWKNLKTGAWCYYNNDSENGKIYGKIYNWFAINDSRGIAPKGFKVASIEDWKVLIEHLGENISGFKLKSAYGWKENRNGNNESGLNILPGGHRMFQGSFLGINDYTHIWTDTVYSNCYSMDLNFNYYSDSIFIYSEGANWNRGYYIRCIKNYANGSSI